MNILYYNATIKKIRITEYRAVKNKISATPMQNLC